MDTHPAPVLAADGRPLREGETVWIIFAGIEGVIERVDYERKGGEACVCVRFADMESLNWVRPDVLTHERPERKCRDCVHWQKDPTADNMGVCWFYYHEHEGQDCYAARRADIGACEEFMPSSKALAGGA